MKLLHLMWQIDVKPTPQNDEVRECIKSYLEPCLRYAHTFFCTRFSFPSLSNIWRCYNTLGVKMNVQNNWLIFPKSYFIRVFCDNLTHPKEQNLLKWYDQARTETLRYIYNTINNISKYSLKILVEPHGFIRSDVGWNQSEYNEQVQIAAIN